MGPRADKGHRGPEGSDGIQLYGVCVGVPEALLNVAWHWGRAGIQGQLSLSVHIPCVNKGSENSKFQTWPFRLY